MGEKYDVDLDTDLKPLPAHDGTLGDDGVQLGNDDNDPPERYDHFAHTTERTSPQR
eukprot:gene14204-3857_t